MESQTVEYNGEKNDRYKAEQKLRYMERNVRNYKRRHNTEAAGVEQHKSTSKKSANGRQREIFTKQTKLERDRVREYIGTKTGKQPRALPQSCKAV